MITKSTINNNLISLNAKYKRTRSNMESLFYSKLAVLELCGWIEESMDDVILRCARRHLQKTENIDFTQNNIIKLTYGFDYKKHFRKMLIQMMGLINVERIESKVDPLIRNNLLSTLGNLKTSRNCVAHTHIKGTTLIIDSPSITLSRFKHVYDGLKEFESVIRNIPFNS